MANQRLRALLREASWSGAEFALALNEAGARAGLALYYQRGSVSQWLAGTMPRPQVAGLVCAVLSLRLGRLVTLAQAGLAAPDGPAPPGGREEYARAAVAELAALTSGPLRTARSPSAGQAWFDVSADPLSVPRFGFREDGGRPVGQVRRRVEHAEALLSALSALDLSSGGGQVRHALGGGTCR
ncbi:hypothetical protein KSE_76200t [Kitasatospora setae KM-6054]|uniref:Uncharacterized protein n=1 Tax=Kitasatospora setae (strain ATCC 33774 / DSM 43861 / JCM 3304 / KCC A-0304 / NBRC 14216 / KM-6054) TaxID=452652 RepID=E4MZ13_KITSK|nr:hypothetical protein KSE_00540t [Kitasatospora setae KM-6054]BAJ33372.1 hypothetical protein KSE_76200t [Kitasatospora setae KM-6054]